MEIAPVINCPDFACAEKRFSAAAEWGAPWIHIDVGDCVFAPATTWGSPAELKELVAAHPEANVEVHLMAKNPAAAAEAWLEAGARRLIVHVEILDGAEGKQIDMLIERVTEHGAEVMVALAPGTPVAEVVPYLDVVYAVQCLAVPAGPSGQTFDEEVIEKISYLRLRNPDLFIEVDGGITPAVARRVRDAGADMAASGSFIFDANDPAAAYRELCGV
ncbi:MAG: hypothetical protein V1656_00335 [Candidatus Jorgensenbacteria bacterium]